MNRQGSARWEGAYREGKGNLTSESGTLLKTPFSYASRYDNASGTNPEELLATAHAACYTMALAAQLGASGVKPDSIYTTATVTAEKDTGGYKITGVHLDVTARIPGVEWMVFDRAVENARSSYALSTSTKFKTTIEAKLSAM